MKQTLIFLCLTYILASGCSKDASQPSTPGTNNTPPWPYKMTATIGSTPFSGDTCIFVSGDNQIYCYTHPGPTRYPDIRLYLDGYHGVGAYPFENPNHSYAKLKTSNMDGELGAIGSIIITSDSPDVIGTFTFTTMVSGTVVSNGRFVARKE